MLWIGHAAMVESRMLENPSFQIVRTINKEKKLGIFQLEILKYMTSCHWQPSMLSILFSYHEKWEDIDKDYTK